jgi:hypothetical protein
VATGEEMIHIILKVVSFVAGFTLVAHVVGLPTALIAYPVGYLAAEYLNQRSSSKLVLTNFLRHVGRMVLLGFRTLIETLEYVGTAVMTFIDRFWDAYDALEKPKRKTFASFRDDED